MNFYISNDFLGTRNDFRYSGNSKIYEKEPRFHETLL